jgi:hypothetical protein
VVVEVVVVVGFSPDRESAPQIGERRAELQELTDGSSSLSTDELNQPAAIVLTIDGLEYFTDRDRNVSDTRMLT